MREARCDRGLTIMLHGGGDMRSFAANRVAPVGADHEPRGNLPALLAAQAGTVRDKRDAVDIRRLKEGEGGGSLPVQHLDQRGVGDVVAESLEARARRRELDVWRAQQATRRIDDPDRLQRCGVRQERIPHAKRLQHVDRAFKQRRGARVEGAGRARSRRRPDQRDGSAAVGKRERSGESPPAQLRPRQCRCRSLLPKTARVHPACRLQRAAE